MKCTSIIQRIPVSNASILEEIAVNLEGDAPDLCAIFFSGDPLDDYDILVDCILQDLESVEAL
mgnify:CR=1 FL=1